MLNAFIYISQFIFIILAIAFLYCCYKMYGLSYDAHNDTLKLLNKWQKIFILSLHFFGFVILLGAYENKLDIIILYIQEVLFFLLVWYILERFYKKTHLLLWNLTFYFITLSFIILTRINYQVGERQFYMAVLGYLIALILPKLIEKAAFLKHLSWVYMAISLLLLIAVFFLGEKKGGAINWISIWGFSFQPSEVVKITFIFFLAAYLYEKNRWIDIIICGIPSLALIILLVLQNDLGTALIFFIIFITLVYLSTSQAIYFFGGLAGGSLGAFIAYRFFPHVKRRVVAWQNPWMDIDNTGYQIAHSLFAIGAGGWSGYGLTKGMPKSIPVVTMDFIFAAISEEFGNIFSVILIITLIVFYIIIIHIALKTERRFYYLIASGIGCTFAFQIFLIIGGVTNFIPITGVTLPFISYGGTSILVSASMVGIVQGISNMQTSKKEGEEDDAKHQPKKQKA